MVCGSVPPNDSRPPQASSLGHEFEYHISTVGIVSRNSVARIELEIMLQLIQASS